MTSRELCRLLATLPNYEIIGINSVEIVEICDCEEIVAFMGNDMVLRTKLRIKMPEVLDNYKDIRNIRKVISVE